MNIERSAPIQFIEIKVNVTFRFTFSFTNGIISKEGKINLCMRILSDIGLVSKTNIGYGRFNVATIFHTIL